MISAIATEDGPENDPDLLADLGVVRLADIAPERVEWLWPGRIPLGKLTLLEGDPKVAKSTLTLDIAARVTTGSPMPDGARLTRAGTVVLLTAEDGLGDTVRPRLDATGADPQRVIAWESVPIYSEVGEHVRDRPPTIPGDLVLLEALVRRHGAILVVIDVLSAYLGSDVDGHRDQDVRRALMPLAKLAERTGAAVLVLRHLNKSIGSNALYRGGGSIGIAGAARSILLAAPEPEDESGHKRVLAVTACNVAAPVPALAYQLQSDEDRGCARISWGGATRHTSDDLLAPHSSDEGGARAEAREWLADKLADGPVKAAEMKRAWRATGLGSDSSLDRARRDLHVAPRRDGFGQGATYWWSLPEHAHHRAVTDMNGSADDDHERVPPDLQLFPHDASDTGHAHQERGSDEHALTDEDLRRWESQHEWEVS